MFKWWCIFHALFAWDKCWFALACIFGCMLVGVDCCSELDLLSTFVYGNCRVNLQAEDSSYLNMQKATASCIWLGSLVILNKSGQGYSFYDIKLCKYNYFHLLLYGYKMRTDIGNIQYREFSCTGLAFGYTAPCETVDIASPPCKILLGIISYWLNRC